MKSRTFFALAILSLLTVLSVGLVAAQEPVTLTFWSMWNESEAQAQVIQSWIDEYEELNPNVTIEAVWNGRQNQTLVRTAAGAGTVIDLMDQDADQIAGGLMREGWALPLDDHLAMPALDHDMPLSEVFIPGTLEMFAVDGTVYQLPYIFNTVQFWYDRRILEEVGAEVPQTYQDLLGLCDTLLAADYAPIAAEGNEPYYSTFYITNMLARMKGPGFLLETAEDPTGEAWRDPAILQAAQMTRELWDRGCIPEVSIGYVWPQGQNTLAFGESFMELVGSWLPVELATQTDPEFEWGAFNFPMVEGGEGNVADVNALLLSFMINKDTAHPEEAVDFLRFIMTDENQQEMTDIAKVGVLNRFVEWNPIIEDAELAVQTAIENDAMFYADIDGVYGQYSEYLNTVLGPNYVDLWQNTITPEEFVERMVAQSAEYWEGRSE